ncbi:MAG: tRNA (adenosine(37)-N6)-threonylcarbamoyltransferase complex transferase subunit TsaD, partial [Acidobacteria bacterium]|nr:tRNA (adenosine(37)-N6)-threonylcarbamoyltransferase complex transferase subunit TsaD [Acidobacteriota bacterium]
IDKTEEAIRIFKPSSIALAGGVAANTLLRKRFSELAQANDIDFSIPPLKYCTDNAAMVGFNGFLKWRKNLPSEFESDAFSSGAWQKIGGEK